MSSPKMGLFLCGVVLLLGAYCRLRVPDESSGGVASPN